MSHKNKPLVWLYGEVKTPPFSQAARIEAGVLLRQLQDGISIRDEDKNWRIIYRIDDDAIVIIEVFSKTTQATPKSVIEVCKKRLKNYDR